MERWPARGAFKAYAAFRSFVCFVLIIKVRVMTHVTRSVSKFAILLVLGVCIFVKMRNFERKSEKVPSLIFD